QYSNERHSLQSFIHSLPIYIISSNFSREFFYVNTIIRGLEGYFINANFPKGTYEIEATRRGLPNYQVTSKFSRETYKTSAFIHCLSFYKLNSATPLYRYYINSYRYTIGIGVKNIITSNYPYQRNIISAYRHAHNRAEITLNYPYQRNTISANRIAINFFQLTANFSTYGGNFKSYRYCLSFYPLSFSYARETHRIPSYIYCIEARRLNAATSPNYFNIKGRFFTPLKYQFNAFINLKSSSKCDGNYIIKSFNPINYIIANNQIENIDSFIIGKYFDYIDIDYKIHEQLEINTGYYSTTVQNIINWSGRLKLIYVINSFWEIYNRFPINCTILNVKYFSNIELSYVCSEPYNVQYSISARIICHKQFLNTHPDKQLVHVHFNKLRVRQND
ncbi:MAG: hypothetical protein KC589_08835, partial [Nanoarchaeota archaeon]|nr:hypothetical protein [Nanoarchaeota archaeon]